MTEESEMMHPLAGTFLVTEAAYRRERAIANFRPFRRNRTAELDTEFGSVTTAAAQLPRQRTPAGSTDQKAAHHQHAA
jgi:hypothetical protein